MPKHTRRSPAHNNLLPFDEWVQKRYPDKKLLRMIGALDLIYLLYRAGIIEKKEDPAHEIAPIRRAIRKTASVPKPEDEQPVPKRGRRKTARRAGSKKKAAELTLEFDEAEPQPLPEPEAKARKDKPEPAPEPEPLMLNEETPEKSTKAKGAVWFGDEELEDADLRKTDLALAVGGIAVGFDVRTIDDEPETLLTVNNVPYRVSLVSPSMNLGGMLRTARVTYGELYVLGRAALGALSGEGYVSADEAERVIRALHEAGSTVTDLDIAYFTKDAKTKNRDTASIRVRFEPL